ncbi:MAG: glycosyltransferase family 4 protein [Taibaiella sp.]|nr:glycosyltransferase family 4 protein [Taibaiella sp.]
MKILELNYENGWRGGERQTLYNMIGFRNAGHVVSLVCRRDSLLAKKADAEGFTILPFRNIFGVVGYLLRKGGRYDVLHAQTSHILTWCVFSRLFHSSRIVYTRRVSFLQSGALTKLKYLLTDVIVGVSNTVKKNIDIFTRRDVPVISDIVIPQQPDRQRAEKLLAQSGIGIDKRLVGTIAMMTPEKDPITMVEVVHILAQQRNDFVFIHVGAGKLEEEVRLKIAAYGLREVYKIAGYVDEPQDLLSVMDVFAMSSVNEGLGSTVLDAYLLRVPVVATKAGGMADILANGNGIACDIKNAAMIAEGINKLLNDGQLVSVMTDRAYEYVLANHSMQHITDQYQALLQ